MWAAILIGFGVRIYDFGSVPPGLNQDEASTAYDAFALWSAGIDRNGFPFPVMLVSWGSGMYALASYVAMPFIALFGLSVPVIRLPSLFIGMLTIPLLYTFLKETTDRPTARTGALLLAITPWHIMISRWGLDSNLFPAVFLLGAVCLLKGLRNDRWLVLSAAFFALTLYSYGTAYVVLPVFAVLCAGYLLAHRALPLKRTLIAGGVFLLLALPIIFYLLINTFDWPSFVTPVFSIPALSGVPRYETMANLPFVNPDFFSTSREHLLSAWRLLATQDDGLIWNALPPFGLLYLFSTPVALLGFGLLIERIVIRSFRPAFVLFAWCIASLTLVAFLSVNINRANIAVLPLLCCTAIGLSFLRAHRFVFVPLVAAYAVSFLQFTHAYLGGDYAARAAPAFFAGLGDAIEDAAERTDGTICVTTQVNMPYIFTLFFTQEDPRVFTETAEYDNPGAEFQSVRRYGRFVFGLDRCGGATVLIAHQDERDRFFSGLYALRDHGEYVVVERR